MSDTLKVYDSDFILLSRSPFFYRFWVPYNTVVFTINPCYLCGDTIFQSLPRLFSKKIADTISANRPYDVRYAKNLNGNILIFQTTEKFVHDEIQPDRRELKTILYKTVDSTFVVQTNLSQHRRIDVYGVRSSPFAVAEQKNNVRGERRGGEDVKVTNNGQTWRRSYENTRFRSSVSLPTRASARGRGEKVTTYTVNQSRTAADTRFLPSTITPY